eukprot:7019058-Prorocentrum_lima.AAC.1
MTSSLVGSEMCIRDSIWRGQQGSELARGHWRILIAKPQGLMQLSHRAVSYTHLTLPTICSV